MDFRRVELGVRIEGPSAHPFFGALVAEGASIDPKWIIGREEGTSWRTFCCCVDGELVEVEIDGRRCWSGRADVPPTGRSNVGFNVRFGRLEDAPCVADIGRRGPWRGELLSTLRSSAGLAELFGSAGAEALVEGLARLVQRFPSALERGPEPLVLWGPCLEGVGHYPRTDEHLQVPGLPLFVAGDATGRFRGLIAAMVSGAYVGRRAALLIEQPGTRSGSTLSSTFIG